jgi:hypothetical protein
VLPFWVTFHVARIRRGGFIFITWKGDHSPHHVHVYKDSGFVVKWDLDHDRPMSGSASTSLVRLIERLRKEGQL